MFTRAEKGYLALTLFFLGAGSGIKAYRHASVRLGPFPDPAFGAPPSSSVKADSLPGQGARPDSTSGGMVSPLGQGAPADSGVNDSSRAAAGDTLAGAATPPLPAETGGRASGSVSGHSSGSSAGKSAFTGKVNLNRAEAAELTRVKGIGEKTAQAIILYRRVHGPFRDLRDLLQVKGIGEKKLEKVRSFLIL
ncbi:MAG: hypothetical protein JWO30_2910 [Fibrobacteres bacterium]|nr:hypothetical protein [Fibrobacterota bacterium]